MAAQEKTPQQDPLLRDAPEIEGFKVLDPCILVARVGAGGMGAVYRGVHLKFKDLEVAVKVLKPGLAQDDEQFVLRFQREATLAASITHQNLIHTMDVQSRHGLHYMVMEFVRGETARERVQRKGPLAEREAIAILLGAATGLGAAHERGIVHRDVKPDNVLISVRGEVKVSDLGLAKARDGGGDSMTLTHGIMGTPQYMAPEQWEDTAEVGPAGDVWALGATLYFLLTGDNAIAPGKMAQVADRIRFQPFPDVRQKQPATTPELCAILERCVQRRPEDRFANAKAVARELRRLLPEAEGVLDDDETGTGTQRVALVSPPPAHTVARIRQIVTGAATPATALAETVGSAAAGEPASARPEPAPTVPPPSLPPTRRVEPAPPAAASSAPEARTASRSAAWIGVLVLLACVGATLAASALGRNSTLLLAQFSVLALLAASVVVVWAWRWIAALRRQGRAVWPGWMQLGAGFASGVLDWLVGSGSVVQLLLARAVGLTEVRSIPGTLHLGNVLPALACVVLAFKLGFYDWYRHSDEPYRYGIAPIVLALAAGSGAWIASAFVARLGPRGTRKALVAVLLVVAAASCVELAGAETRRGFQLVLWGVPLAMAALSAFGAGVLMAPGINALPGFTAIAILTGATPDRAAPVAVLFLGAAIVRAAASLRFLDRGTVNHRVALGLALGGLAGVLVGWLAESWLWRVSPRAVGWLSPALALVTAVRLLAARQDDAGKDAT